MASPRPMRFVITRRPYEKWYVRLLLSQMKTINLDISNPAPAMEKARHALLRGEAVVMFPENAMTSTGNMNRFRLDYSAAIRDVPKVKLLPFYVQGLWGSSYSMADAGFKDLVHSGGRIVTVAFGNELPLEADPVTIKRAVQELSITAWETYIRKLRPVASAWIRTAKKVGSGPSVYSPDGKHLSAHTLTTAVLSFAKVIDKLTIGEKQVGVLIPPSGPGIIANMACLVRGKTVYNLNYTNTPETMDYCCGVADVKSIITAKVFVEKLKQKGINMDILLSKYKVYYMEDLKEMIPKRTMILNFLRVLVLPAWYLELRFFKKVTLDDVATVIFSSGSEGRPKGVEVNIHDVNEPPSISDETIAVPESTTVWTVVDTVKATDPDKKKEYSQLTYTIVDGDSAVFMVDPHTGAVILKDTLDYEAKKSYVIYVQVYDGEFADTAKVKINVTNVIEYTDVVITKYDNVDSTWNYPDTVYTNKKNGTITWRQDDEIVSKDTVLKKGKNVIVISYKNPTKDKAGADTVVIMFNDEVPVVEVTANPTHVKAENVFTIVENMGDADTNIYVNKERDSVYVHVKDPANKRDTSFALEVNLEPVKVPDATFRKMSSRCKGSGYQKC